MGHAIDLAGQRFGRIVVTARADNLSGRVRWHYQCDCGGSGIASAGHIRRGWTRSCGCLRRDTSADSFTTHGHRKDLARSPTNSSWTNMRARCLNPRHPAFKNYGGRGITVCDRWSSFANFLEDMGECPKGLTLERKDVNGNYDPGNCVWATRGAQASNKRDQAKWLIGDQLLTQSQAMRYWGATQYRTQERLVTIPVAQGRIPAWHPSHHKEKK